MASAGPDVTTGNTVTTYFGSKGYYAGELLKDQRYNSNKHLDTLTVTLPNGDKITMWSYAIDVRACDDPVKELPERGFNEEDDYVVFHYTDKEGFDNIISSNEIWASLSESIDSHFGPGGYASRKSPCDWRSKEEIFINNFFPSKKDWQQRKHLDFTDWPSVDALKFNKLELIDHELDELLNTPFGQAVLKKWESTRKCDFCIPIVCDYHCAQDVMKESTFAGIMGNDKTRRAGYNKFEEKQPSWRDVWILVKSEKTLLQQQGSWKFQMCNLSQPPGLILELQQRRQELADAKAAAVCTQRGRRLVDAASDGDLPAVRGLLREDPAAVHFRDGGWTALHRAAVPGGRVAVCEVLLAAAADPNATDDYRLTPLHVAAVNGQAEAVRCLLTAKAKVDAKSSSGDTPLHYAATYGRQEVLRPLLVARAAVDIKNKWGESVLDVAKKGGHRETIQVLKNASR